MVFGLWFKEQDIWDSVYGISFSLNGLRNWV